MKLSDWCKKQGIHYMTGYKWFKEGKIPNSRQMETGTILVDDVPSRKSRLVIYCRVSSSDGKKDLEYQVDRCKQYCLARGYQVDSIYKEIASGMNDSRKEFWRMLDSNPTKVIIENKDRLTRFGFEYISRLGKKNGIDIEVIYPNENNETDLMKDLVSIITSFFCRLYGLRRGQNKALKIREELKQE